VIGRVWPLGSSFKGAVLYMETGKDGLLDPRERVDWVEFRNLPTRNARTAACIMAATASESVSGTATPAYLFSVSFDPGDSVNPATLRLVADRVIRDMRLTEYQSLVYSHKDRAHPHLHFIVNRVHPERHTLWRNWQDYLRLERSLRALEQELGLRIVPGWNSVVVLTPDGGLRVPQEHETGLTRVFPRSGPSRGDAGFLRDIAARAAPVLEQARSWAELERGLAEQGLSLRTKGGGFTLTDGTRQVKASEVGRTFSRFHLEKRLGGYPDYRARMAVAEIAPARPAPGVVQREAPPGPVEAPARTERPVPSAPPLSPEGRVNARRKVQFGDAGHGIGELFSGSPAEAERPGPPLERAPTPSQRSRTFLRTAREQATPVLERAASWAEVESGLAAHGLSLRESGGGFVVTDGNQEVKASEVGRAFSRFHLEKRLGSYPHSRAQGAVDEAAPAQPAPAAEPERAAGQPEQLSLPLALPPVARVQRDPPAPAGPGAVPGDDATPEGRRIVGPAPEGLGDGVPPLQPVARVQHDAPAPAGPGAGPQDDALTQPPEQVPVPERVPAPAAEPPRPRPMEPPAPTPAVPREEPLLPPVARVQHDAPAPAGPGAGPQDDAATQPPEQVMVPERVRAPAAEPPRPRPMEPPAPTPAVRREEPRTPAQPPARRVEPHVREPVRRRQEPDRKRTAPLTDRERYRAVLAAFKDKLAALYLDTRAARRAFDEELARSTPEAAARVLTANPEQFGRVRFSADLRRLEEAGPWAELYGRWKIEGTRLDARYAVARFRRAVAVEEADAVLRDTRASFDGVFARPSFLKDRENKADEGERILERRLREVYDRPWRAREAIEAYRSARGTGALVRALQESPEQFGRLRTEWKPVLGIPVIPQTKQARQSAGEWSTYIGGALNLIADQPTREEHTRAEDAIGAARQTIDAAQKARDALGSASATDSVREALARLHVAGRGNAARTARLDRQVTSMLPGRAIQVVRTLMQEVARQHEREIAREQRRSRGLDIN